MGFSVGAFARNFDESIRKGILTGVNGFFQCICFLY